MRRVLAIILANFAITISRMFSRGSGSVIGGAIARMINPKITKDLSRDLKTIVITGTNGKTTSVRLIAQILKADGRKVVFSHLGANMINAVTSVLLSAYDILGRKKADYAIIEVDEGTIYKVIGELQPIMIGLTNFFRDQLDRYGEIDVIAKKIADSLSRLPARTVILINANDPAVVYMADFLKEQTVKYYGIRSKSDGPEQTSDSTYCLRCGNRLKFLRRHYSHISDFICLKCGYKTPKPDLAIAEMANDQAEIIDHNSAKFKLALPGRHNLSNAALAALAGRCLGISNKNIIRALTNFKPAFGRGEIIKAGNQSFQLQLVKNPTSFNQALNGLNFWQKPVLLIAINDNYPDGRDISWLWDVDFEALNNKVQKIILSGTRGWDMAVRLKYAEFKPSDITISTNINTALDQFLAGFKSEPAYVFSTYTATLAIRENLRKKGAVAPIWELE